MKTTNEQGLSNWHGGSLAKGREFSFFIYVLGRFPFNRMLIQQDKTSNRYGSIFTQWIRIEKLHNDAHYIRNHLN